MLIGEYTSRVGEKKRVAIPKKLRGQLGDGLILTRGYEHSLVLVDQTRWEIIAKEVIDGSFINKDIRDTTRFLVGSAVEISPDPQGRVVIPDNLFRYDQIESEIVFIGLVNWVEIWDRSKWEERLVYLDQHSSEIADSLGRKGKDE